MEDNISMEDPDYMRNIIKFAILVAIIMLVVLGVLYVAEASEKPFVATRDLFYIAPRIPYFPETVVLGTRVNIEVINIVETLNCMVVLESSNNPLAYNPLDIDNRPKFGLLQYDADTWQTYCVAQFGFNDNIWDGNLQYLCADTMIRNNLGYHWPSYWKCLDK